MHYRASRNPLYNFSSYMMAQRELVILSVPSLCLPSTSSLPFLPANTLDAFIPDSFAPFPESELLVFLVPTESVEDNRTSFELDDPEEQGATAREGRMMREERALRMSCVVFRMISSTDTLSAPISAVFLASSN